MPRRRRKTIEAGPNAVLSFKREGYKKYSFNLKDAFETLTYPGFSRIALKYWKTGIMEFYRSFFKGAFVKALSRLTPEISVSDLSPGGSGVRAQACDNLGNLIDDFLIHEDAGVINILNAPSPAATSALSIGDFIADKAIIRLLK